MFTISLCKWTFAVSVSRCANGPLMFTIGLCKWTLNVHHLTVQMNDHCVCVSLVVHWRFVIVELKK
jgi:hypothetical protein